MKILLTGGTGFFGSHLLRGLIKDRHHVILIKRQKSDIWRIRDIISKVEVFDLDLDTSGIRNLREKCCDVDVCIHTATSYGRSKKDLKNLLKANILIPLELILLLEEVGCKYFINTDTFFTLDKKNNYLNDYTTSKVQFKDWAVKLSELCGIQFINMRLFHIYGPMDRDDKFTSYIFENLINNRSISLNQSEQLRDFIYVKDAVQAFTVVLKHISQNGIFEKETFDVGTGSLFSVLDFTKKSKRIFKSKSSIGVKAVLSHTDTSKFTKANTDSLRKIGWSPKTSLDEGILDTLNSINNLSNKDL